MRSTGQKFGIVAFDRKQEFKNSITVENFNKAKDIVIHSCKAKFKLLINKSSKNISERLPYQIFINVLICRSSCEQRSQFWTVHVEKGTGNLVSLLGWKVALFPNSTISKEVNDELVVSLYLSRISKKSRWFSQHQLRLFVASNVSTYVVLRSRE